MMRANSHDSVTVASDTTVEPVTQVVTPSKEMEMSPLMEHEPRPTQTPPHTGLIPERTGHEVDADETPRPHLSDKVDVADEEPTPRPLTRLVSPSGI
jgi:serine/threonine-protein kinase RIM15